MEADWSNLPTDLWSVVGYKLGMGVDRIRFRSVCNAFRSSLPFPQPPWLVLPDPNEPQPDSDSDSDDDSDDYDDDDDSDDDDDPYDYDYADDDDADADADDDEEEEEEEEEEEYYNYEEEVNINQPPIPSPRGLVGLGDQNVYELHLPEAYRKRFVGSTGTWLITVDTYGIVCLLNPFSGVQSQFRSSPTSIGYDHVYHSRLRHRRDLFVCKVLLSSASANDCVAMAIHCGWRKLAVSRLRDTFWTRIEPTSAGNFEDMIFYKGRFYIVNCVGEVFVCDIGDDRWFPSTSILMGPFGLLQLIPGNDKFYLAEWMGDLLLVIKMMNKNEAFKYMREIYHREYLKKLERDHGTPLCKTEGFKVYKLDFTNRKWDELKSLGEYSLFLGGNTSVSILPSDFNGRVKKNCINFTVDYTNGYSDTGIPGSRAMEVFDMESNNIQPHYEGISTPCYSSPIWLIPTPLPKSY